MDEDIENPNPLASTTTEGKPSIFRVPKCYHSVKPEAYTPVVVSFGPFHNGADYLIPIEKHKKRVVQRFDKLAGDGSREKVVAAVLHQISDLKRCYDRLPKPWKDDADFAGLMVSDGLFMIALLDTYARTSKENAASSNTDAVGAQNEGITHNGIEPMVMGDGLGFPPSDPVFGKKAREYLWPYIRRDMLLVENQIPLKVLQILLGTPFCWHNTLFTIEQQLHRLVLQFLDRPFDHGMLVPLGISYHHVLHMYRTSHVLVPTRQGFPIEGARKLYLNGVNFKQRRNATYRFTVQIEKNTILFPELDLDDIMESVLLNTLVLERLHDDTGDEVTKFMLCMTRLVCTPLDCQVLRTCRVRLSHVWTDDVVADFFKRVARGFPLLADNTSRPKFKTPPCWYSFTAQFCRLCRYFRILSMEGGRRWRAYITTLLTITSLYFTVLNTLLNLLHGKSSVTFMSSNNTTTH